ncbi:MAG TPA: hypothetical protein VKY89_05660, partial [Thermoanaerobaculia bacterium]|nr:hypothetical protein [Thermoanaerobaculia bacterium]
AMTVAADLMHMVGLARRIREQAPGIGRRSASLLQLALVTRRQADECFAAVHHHFDTARGGSGEEIATDRLEGIVATRGEATQLFQRVVTEAESGSPALSSAELELEGAVAGELERISDLAAAVVEQLILNRTGPADHGRERSGRSPDRLPERTRS